MPFAHTRPGTGQLISVQPCQRISDDGSNSGSTCRLDPIGAIVGKPEYAIVGVDYEGSGA